MSPKPKETATKKNESVGRIVKAEDWSATPVRGMAAFSYSPFRGKSKTAATPTAPEDPHAFAIDSKNKIVDELKRALAEEKKAHEETRRISFEKGLEQGKKEEANSLQFLYMQSFNKLQSEVENVFSTLKTEKDNAFLEFESHSMNIVSFAFTRIFGELSGNFPEAVLPLIREAIASLGRSSTLVVKVNPIDLPLVENHRAFWQKLEYEGEAIRCLMDDRVPQGGCLVVGDATAARVDLESLGIRLGEAVKSACAERKKIQ